MKSQLIEQASKVIPDPAVLINVVSTRVKQLNQGYQSTIKSSEGSFGSADIALMEIIAGKIEIAAEGSTENS